jgi:hypothetical protein
MSNEDDLFSMETEQLFYDEMPEQLAELVETEEYKEFLRSIAQELEQGVPLTHSLASAIMTLFRPGFVIIGSPHMEDMGDGTLMSEHIGVAMSTDVNMTPSNMGTVLSLLGASMSMKAEAEFLTLKEESDNE